MRGEVLTRADVRALIKACNADCPTGLRNRALISMAYRAGLRSAELVALTPIDVVLAELEVRVRRGKGNKCRVVPIDVECIALVQRWLLQRAKLKAKRIDPLFCTLSCTQLGTHYLRELMPRLAARAELGRRVHPHALRHTYAAELAREGVPLVQISRLLGHSRLETTATYLASLVTPEELRDVARARPSWTA